MGILRKVYENTPIIRRMVTAARTFKYTGVAKQYRPPFTRDHFLTEAMDGLIRQGGLSHFVETGTYLADTTRHLAKTHPDLKIFTVEAHPVYFGASGAILGAFPNVEQILDNSADALERLLVESRVPERVICFLDAHWHDYLPLPREIQLLGEHRREAIFAIHDFEVPDRAHFRFDTYHGESIGLDMLKASLNKERSYHVLLPNYEPVDVYGDRASDEPPMRGHAIVFQGMTDLLDDFRSTPPGARYTVQAL